MEYYSAIKKKAVVSVQMRLMNLEPIIQSKIIQKEKRKYHIQMHIYIESRKMVLIKLFSRQQWRHRYRLHTYEHGVGGGRRGWAVW